MSFLFKQHPEFPSHFDAIVTACDVTHSKPHPEPYLVGARKAGALPSECLVFEDSYQGLESGRKAGCKVIGISTTNPAAEVRMRCDIEAPSLASLAQRIQELLS